MKNEEKDLASILSKSTIQKLRAISNDQEVASRNPNDSALNIELLEVYKQKKELLEQLKCSNHNIGQLN
jgi:hypothetical protein